MVPIKIATSPSFGGLNPAIDAFQDLIRPKTLSTLPDAGPVGLDRSSGLANGIEAAMSGPKTPMAEEAGRFVH